jgi:ubiquinone/menaquinone biosynthesis C-methylase UbiE
MAQAKPYRGLPMEGAVARWYARNTARDARRFREGAEAVAARAAPGARVLEVAPGPGYLAIELARRGYRVTGLDVSRSFVRIARENAARAGVAVDFEEGDAAHLPFPDASFDHVVCMAAFKNFADPVGALDEMHRVLRPGGEACIHDLRKDASLSAIEDEVRAMGLSSVNAALTRWTFRFLLLRSAHPRDALERMASASRFGVCEIRERGIGLEMRLPRCA